MEWKKLRQTIQKAKAENRSPNGRSWFTLYQDHIVTTLDGTTDDMLFYVKSPSTAVRPYSSSGGGEEEGEKQLEIYRVEDTKRPGYSDRNYNWMETFYLNMLLHNFTFMMTCAVCEQKLPGSSKKLKIFRSFNVQVYGSPNVHKMSGKAKKTSISYPDIYFSVHNFDEIFNGIVLTDNEMVCVELVAQDRAETVQISVFLGSVRYEILRSTLENRASLKSKFLKQISLGYYAGEPASQFITMNGPKCRGRVEMCVSCFKPDVNKDFVVSFDREADHLDTDSRGSDALTSSVPIPGTGNSQLEQNKSMWRHSTHVDDLDGKRRLSNNTKQRFVSTNWIFKASSNNNYVNAQLTYLTLRWDQLLDDLMECKKIPTLQSVPNC